MLAIENLAIMSFQGHSRLSQTMSCDRERTISYLRSLRLCGVVSYTVRVNYRHSRFLYHASVFNATVI